MMRSNAEGKKRARPPDPEVSAPAVAPEPKMWSPVEHERHEGSSDGLSGLYNLGGECFLPDAITEMLYHYGNAMSDQQLGIAFP